MQCNKMSEEYLEKPRAPLRNYQYESADKNFKLSKQRHLNSKKVFGTPAKDSYEKLQIDPRKDQMLASQQYTEQFGFTGDQNKNTPKSSNIPRNLPEYMKASEIPRKTRGPSKQQYVRSEQPIPPNHYSTIDQPIMPKQYPKKPSAATSQHISPDVKQPKYDRPETFENVFEGLDESQFFMSEMQRVKSLEPREPRKRPKSYKEETTTIKTAAKSSKNITRTESFEKWFNADEKKLMGFQSSKLTASKHATSAPPKIRYSILKKPSGRLSKQNSRAQCTSDVGDTNERPSHREENRAKQQQRLRRDKSDDSLEDDKSPAQCSPVRQQRAQKRLEESQIDHQMNYLTENYLPDNADDAMKIEAALPGEGSADLLAKTMLQEENLLANKSSMDSIFEREYLSQQQHYQQLQQKQQRSFHRRPSKPITVNTDSYPRTKIQHQFDKKEIKLEDLQPIKSLNTYRPIQNTQKTPRAPASSGKEKVSGNEMNEIRGHDEGQRQRSGMNPGQEHKWLIPKSYPRSKDEYDDKSYEQAVYEDQRHSRKIPASTETNRSKLTSSKSNYTSTSEKKRPVMTQEEREDKEYLTEQPTSKKTDYIPPENEEVDQRQYANVYPEKINRQPIKGNEVHPDGDVYPQGDSDTDPRQYSGMNTEIDKPFTRVTTMRENECQGEEVYPPQEDIDPDQRQRSGMTSPNDKRFSRPTTARATEIYSDEESPVEDTEPEQRQPSGTISPNDKRFAREPVSNENEVFAEGEDYHPPSTKDPNENQPMINSENKRKSKETYNTDNTPMAHGERKHHSHGGKKHNLEIEETGSWMIRPEDHEVTVLMDHCRARYPEPVQKHSHINSGKYKETPRRPATEHLDRRTSSKVRFSDDGGKDSRLLVIGKEIEFKCENDKKDRVPKHKKYREKSRRAKSEGKHSKSKRPYREVTLTPRGSLIVRVHAEFDKISCYDNDELDTYSEENGIVLKNIEIKSPTYEEQYMYTKVPEEEIPKQHSKKYSNTHKITYPPHVLRGLKG